MEDISQFSGGEMKVSDYIEWVDKYQAQLIVLAAQINWSSNVEDALVNGGGDGLGAVLKIVEDTLTVLADSVLQEQPPVRKRLENLVSIVCIFLCTLVYSSIFGSTCNSINVHACTCTYVGSFYISSIF